MNASPPADGIKLHIGGQEKREGWAILDALPGPYVDYVGNCNDLSFLADNSCSLKFGDAPISLNIVARK
jgi:predicted SAM-dependent methyltransferase